MIKMIILGSAAESYFFLQLDGQNVPNEIALMHRLSPCPQIIEMIEWFERPDSYIIILERPEPCLDLFDYISKEKSLDEDVARTFFWEVNRYSAARIRQPSRIRSVLTVLINQ